MKCIDVIEGAVKSILTQVHTAIIEDRLDDTDYVRMTRSIIDGTDQFVSKNPELVDDPQLLKQVLYDFARNLWLMNQKSEGEAAGGQSVPDSPENDEYQTYYYDYLYHRGLYPR